MQIEILGVELPNTECGSSNSVHVGVQRGSEVVDIHAASEPEIRWLLEVGVQRDPSGAIDLRGPYIHGPRGSRFLYLSWGMLDDGGTFKMFRRAKLLVSDIEPRLLQAALEEGSRFTARVSLTGQDGTPRCGSVRPPAIQWIVSSGAVR